MLAGVEASDDLLGGVPPTALTANAGLALLAAADACTRRDRISADSWRTVADELVGVAPRAPASVGGAAAVGAYPPEAASLVDISYARAFGTDAMLTRYD